MAQVVIQTTVSDHVTVDDQSLAELLTNSQAKLGADIPMTSADTFYGTTAVTLAAGTWLLTAQVTVARTTTTACTYTSRIYNGSSAEVSGGQFMTSNANNLTTITMSCIVTPSGSTTYTVQAASNVSACVMKAAVPVNGQGNNATTITAIKLA